jgi:hypothetical protein
VTTSDRYGRIVARRLPRWSVLAFALAAAGAVLVMHGLDGSAMAHGPQAVPADAHHDDDCPDCGPLQLVAACIAVLGLGAAALVARRAAHRSAPTVAMPTIAPARRTHPRARGPAWVELSVMRC